jgi:hypothetical protein
MYIVYCQVLEFEARGTCDRSIDASQCAISVLVLSEFLPRLGYAEILK